MRQQREKKREKEREREKKKRHPYGCTHPHAPLFTYLVGIFLSQYVVRAQSKKVPNSMMKKCALFSLIVVHSSCPVKKKKKEKEVLKNLQKKRLKKQTPYRTRVVVRHTRTNNTTRIHCSCWACTCCSTISTIGVITKLVILLMRWLTVDVTDWWRSAGLSDCEYGPTPMPMVLWSCACSRNVKIEHMFINLIFEKKVCEVHEPHIPLITRDQKQFGKVPL